MKVERFVAAVACSAAAVFAFGSYSPMQARGEDRQAPGVSSHYHSPSSDRDQTNELVQRVRAATERFRDVKVAESEGYTLQFGCVSGSDVGAMGLHYVNFPLVLDGELDPEHPEIVIYEPTPSGRLKITGADFLVFADAWNAKHPEGPPQLGGQLFHLFESPNRFGLDAFYTLHVWAWKDNPNGAFVNWHPKVSCDGFSDAK
jgi:hypothetical protein